MIAKIAVVRFSTLLPVAILSMLPTLVGIDRIVTTAITAANAELAEIPEVRNGVRP